MKIPVTDNIRVRPVVLTSTLHRRVAGCRLYAKKSLMLPTVQTLSTLAPALEVHWRRLWRSANGCIFNSWPWVSAWWSEIGRHAHELTPHLAFITDDDVPLALLPLQVRRDSDSGMVMLQPFTSGTVQGCSVLPEYPDLLARPGFRQAALSEYIAEFSRQRILQADLFEAAYLVPECDLSVLISSLAHQHFGVLRASAAQCYSAHLGAGFSAYLGALQPHRRSDCRRLLRLSEKSRLSFELAPITSGALHELFSLHQRAWIERGEQGAFGQDRIRRFHERLIATREDDFAVLIGRLSDSAGPLSIVYGFLLRDVFYFYQSGNVLDAERGVRSNGIVAQLLTMQALAEMGVERYDFLAGEADYKRRLATNIDQVTSLRLFRPSSRVAWAALKSVARRVF